MYDRGFYLLQHWQEMGQANLRWDVALPLLLLTQVCSSSLQMPMGAATIDTEKAVSSILHKEK
jgi:hypothetical protein